MNEVVLPAVIIAVLIYSIVLHEVAHGWVALCNGDPTAKILKRLTLNPLRHIDWIGTVVLPVALYFLRAPFLIGWARPVPYNPAYFRQRALGTLTVGIAGVFVNLLLAFLFSRGFSVYKETQWGSVLAYGLSINLVLAIFNLIPIPPLDGAKVASVFLPGKLSRFFAGSGDRAGMLILLILLYFGIISKIIAPLYSQLFSFFISF